MHSLLTFVTLSLCLVGSTDHRANQASEIQRHPAVSPNGEQVAYISNANERNSLFVSQLEKWEPVQLTSDASMEFFPSWSADGERLLVASNKSGRFQIYECEIATRTLKQITDGNVNALAAVYSPGGEHIAYHTVTAGMPGEIWVVDRDGSNPRRIGEGIHPQWTPDGESLVFAATPEEGDIQQIFRCELDGSKREQLTFLENECTYPNINAKDGRILFTCEQGDKFTTYLIDPDGIAAELIREFGDASRHPSWCPDGTSVVLNVLRDGAWTIEKRELPSKQ